MSVARIVGQPPKIRAAANGGFVQVAPDGYVLTDPDLYLTCDAGGGFDDPEVRSEFRAIGTRVKRVADGSPSSYAITEFHIPSEEEGM